MTDQNIIIYFGFGLFVLFMARLALLWGLPLDLSGDEAYYWEWGRRLDWGYFSKPPGIGWLMALIQWIGMDSTFGIRSVAVLLGTGSLLFLFLLASSMYDFRVALLATLLFAATPANAAVNMILTIDAPLVFFWLAALYFAWRLFQSNGQSAAWGLALGLALAGGLLAKQMMLVFPICCILLLLASPGYRLILFRPWFWISLAIGIAAMIPSVLWNMRHDWLTVSHTMDHFQSGNVDLLRNLVVFLEFFGSQLGLASPILFVLLLTLLVMALIAWPRLSFQERFLFMFCGPGLLLTMALGLSQRVQPNWPLAFYPSGIVLVAAWGMSRGALENVIRGWRAWLGKGFLVGLSMACATYFVVWLLANDHIRAGGWDVSSRIRGWSTLAADVQNYLGEVPRPEQTIIIAVSHRYLASHLAFYLPDRPTVYLFNSRPEHVGSQYDLWPSPAKGLGTDALVIVQERDGRLPEHFGRIFEQIRHIGTLEYPEFGKQGRKFTLYLGRVLRDWPETSAAFRPPADESLGGQNPNHGTPNS